jgi:tetratricopeptide (TPR) repeat protein
MDACTLRGLRVVLVEPDEAAADRLAVGLDALGAAVESFRTARAGLARLRAGRVDAVLLAAPLADADPIGVAALVKEGAEPPALLLLDGAGLAGSLLRALPADRGPDAVLDRHPKAEAVAAALAAAVEAAPASLPSPEAGLPELLVSLREQAATGTLEIRADGVCTRIALRAGAPVFADGGSLRETLGRMLLRRGALSEADYVRVIERMTERIMESETTRMGEVLVELGLRTPAEVFEALSEQVREKIVSCFRWPRFERAFQPAEALPDELLAYPCPPLEALLLEGLREHYGPDRLEPLLAPHAARRPALAADLAALAARFQLTVPEQRMLRGLDGERTLAVVREAAPLDAVHAAQVLAALVVAGGVVWRADRRAPAAPPRSAAVPVEAGLRPAAAPEAATQSAKGAAAATRTLGRLRLARTGRQPVDPKSAGLEAERAFRQGLVLLAQPALPGALRAFGRACALKGDEPEYRMYEAWTELLVARDDETRAVARAKAGACAQRMLQRDRDSVRAHAILGQLAAAAGDLDTAERHFRAALRTAPEDRDALRGLRLLEKRRSPR